MGPRGKMVIGALLVVLGAWWYVPGGPFNAAPVSFSTLTNIQSLAVTFQGGLGIFLIIVGAFVVWIERDEMRVRKELASRDIGQGLQDDIEPYTGESNDEAQDAVEPYTDGSDEATEEETHTCPECGREFDSPQGLNGHKGQAHSS